MKRSHCADMFGPTTGDKVRLGDTSLILDAGKFFTVYGDECKFGGGNNLADGKVSAEGTKAALKRVKQQGFANESAKLS